jgi:hypothetical protein
MQPTLVVVRPFGSHDIGDAIIAPADVTKILASDHREHVVKVAPRKTEA